MTSQDGASPRHQFAFQSFLDLPKHIEFSQILRSVSVLPAVRVPAYQTADVRLSWKVIPAAGIRGDRAQNLFQPHHTWRNITATPAGS